MTKITPNTGAFDGSSIKTNLSVIKVPVGYTSLANNSLGGTTTSNNILSIVLPWTITSIGANALRHNVNLRELVCYSKIPPTIGTNALNNLSTNTKIRVPLDVVEDYKSASGWNAHASKIWSI